VVCADNVLATLAKAGPSVITGWQPATRKAYWRKVAERQS
jgi:hypothetical protein